MPGPVFLAGKRLTLRLPQPEDYELLAGHYNDPSVRRQFGDIRIPMTTEAVANFFGGDEVFDFLACHDGTPVGHVFHRRVDLEGRNAELGYLIAPDQQGKGYATEASDLCLTHAFDGLGLHKVWARVQAGNDASMRVLEKLGFRQEGVLREHWYGFGDHVDEYRFGLLRSERKAE